MIGQWQSAIILKPIRSRNFQRAPPRSNNVVVNMASWVRAEMAHRTHMSGVIRDAVRGQHTIVLKFFIRSTHSLYLMFYVVPG